MKIKMKKIPLCKTAIEDEEINAAIEVIKSGWMAHGPKNHEFEELFENYIGVKHAICMNSCTSALYIALFAMEIKGEVITPSFTFVATVNSIVLAGATPVLVDIDKETRNISPELIEQAITDKTEAIMVVHYAGLPSNMPAIIKIAEKHGLKIIEDSAETLGGSYDGTMTGSYGVGCFSFFPTKNITTGEGGMLTTNDDILAARIRGLIAHGIDSTTYAREKSEKPWLRIASQFGFNFRMSNLLATIGLEQMKRIDSLNAQRTKIAERYIQNLSSIKSIGFQSVPSGYVTSWQMFTILVPSSMRDALLLHLNDRGIGASVHFDPPVHAQKLYSEVRKGSSLAVTEEVSSSLITLPIFPSMTLDEVDFVCRTIADFMAPSDLAQ
jgi:perosamine synthetase